MKLMKARPMGRLHEFEHGIMNKLNSPNEPKESKDSESVGNDSRIQGRKP
jgi:hypothetical protein